MSETRSDLKELSGDDSTDLKAFNEKRKWFESKLKILEAFPPIHPFAPFFDGKELDSCEEAEWAPSTSELAQMQKERDDIEDAVTIFDGGDLVRMKAKTRAVTIQPLTPPSSELVSITLAVIVTVDRLLTLLRRRAELLDLCRLRLTWDRLHTQSLDALDHCQLELDTFVQEYCQWMPDRGSDIGSTGLARAPVTALEPTGDRPSLAEPSTPIALRLDAARPSYHQAQATIDRLGSTLDRMIDTATSLRTKSSPARPGNPEQGAVPDEFLDAQDATERRLASLGDVVANHSRLLEFQSQRVIFCWTIFCWTTWLIVRADRIYAAIASIRTTGRSMLNDLRDTKTVASLAATRKRIERAQAQLPPPLHLLPDEAHADDATSAHNQAIRVILDESRNVAKIYLSQVTGACDWLERREILHSTIVDLSAMLNDRKGTLVQTFDSMPTDQSLTLPTLRTWLHHAEDLIAQCREHPHVKQATVALMQYRALLSSRPETVKQGEADTVEEDANVVISAVNALTRRLGRAVDEMQRAGELLTLLSALEDAARDAELSLADLSRDIALHVDRNLWPNQMGNDDDQEECIRQRIAALSAVWRSGLQTDMTNLARLTAATDIPDVLERRTKSVRGLVATVERRFNEVDRLEDLASRVQLQSSHVAAIEAKAEDLISSIRAMPFNIGSLRQLRGVIHRWETQSVTTVPMIDAHPSSSAKELDKPMAGGYSLGGAAECRGLLTPPSTPPISNDLSVLQRWDFAATDRIVRDRINQTTSRVRSELDHHFALSKDSEVGLGTAELSSSHSRPEIATTLALESATRSRHGKTSAHVIVRSAQSVASSTASSRMPTPVKTARTSLPNALSISQNSASSSRPRPRLASISCSNLGGARTTAATETRNSERRPQTRRKYVPNVANQLDRAVGAIVNNHSVHVPIEPVNGLTSSEWTDVTGSYWIGAEGRAKLCFCRILRSQTVMVRVGGGWTELSKFLKDHFSESLDVSASQFSISGARQDVSANPPSRVTSPTRTRDVTTDVSPSKLSYPLSSGHAPDLGPGSPLTPLRFMRKASDSPDDRKREKDTLKIGRRSILGKEG